MKSWVINQILIIVWVCLTSSCTAGQDQVNVDSLHVFRVRSDSLVMMGKTDYYEQFSVEQVLTAWRADSNACQGMRNFLMVEFLLQKLEGDLKSDTQVLYILGPPNEIHHGRRYDLGDGNHIIHYIYYFDVRCTDGKPREESDKCWLDVLCHEKTGQVLAMYQPCT